jgi:hypothetical protein
VARFGSANEHSDWETAHHVFTYDNAVHRMLKRIESADRDGQFKAVRGILHAPGLITIRPARECSDGAISPTSCTSTGVTSILTQGAKAWMTANWAGRRRLRPPRGGGGRDRRQATRCRQEAP